MKKILITSLLLSFCLSVISQENFEGVIEFSVNFKDKKGVFTDEEAKTQIGTRHTYYAKGAKFHYTSNGSFKRRGFYNGNDTVFTHFNGMKKVWFNLISDIDSNRMKGYKITEVKKTILGYECTQAIITTSQSSEIIYFTDKLYIDPKYHRNFRHLNLNKYERITKGGMILRHEVDHRDYTAIHSAISIEKKSLKDAIFERPKLEVEPAPKI